LYPAPQIACRPARLTIATPAPTGVPALTAAEPFRHRLTFGRDSVTGFFIVRPLEPFGHIKNCVVGVPAAPHPRACHPRWPASDVGRCRRAFLVKLDARTSPTEPPWRAQHSPGSWRSVHPGRKGCPISSVYSSLFPSESKLSFLSCCIDLGTDPAI